MVIGTRSTSFSSSLSSTLTLDPLPLSSPSLFLPSFPSFSRTPPSSAGTPRPTSPSSSTTRRCSRPSCSPERPSAWPFTPSSATKRKSGGRRGPPSTSQEGDASYHRRLRGPGLPRRHRNYPDQRGAVLYCRFHLSDAEGHTCRLCWYFHRDFAEEEAAFASLVRDRADHCGCRPRRGLFRDLRGGGRQRRKRGSCGGEDKPLLCARLLLFFFLLLFLVIEPAPGRPPHRRRAGGDRAAVHHGGKNAVRGTACPPC